MKPRRVVVVGGGVSGLAAAHRVTEIAPECEVTVLEASSRAGGLIQTEEVDGYVIEEGPDAILTEKPWALDLAKRLGLESELVRTLPGHGGAYVVARGKLERVPEGFSLVAPGKIRPFLTSPILSPAGKLRALGDLLMPRGNDVSKDESLESFVTRRMGREVFERLAQPLVGGIYGADPAELSLSSTMPRFLAMEAEHRSLTLALRRRAQGNANEVASGARYGLFVSFRRGNATLIRGLTDALGARVKLRSSVSAIAKDGAEYVVHVEGAAAPLRCDGVIVALPAWRASAVVSKLDAQLSGRLLGLRYGSSATVTYAWKREDVPHPMDAYGFVVPLVEKRAILASTWASHKWPNRAPDGRVLIRVFVGGAGHEDLVEKDDASLTRLGQDELRDLMGIEASPLFTRINRYRRAAPHYTLGHADRVRSIYELAETHAGLRIAGNAFHGVGIPDSVHSGELAAEALFAE